MPNNLRMIQIGFDSSALKSAIVGNRPSTVPHHVDRDTKNPTMKWLKIDIGNQLVRLLKRNILITSEYQKLTKSPIINHAWQNFTTPK